MRAKAFSLAWCKEQRLYPVSGQDSVRIYIKWKLSASWSKEEWLCRQFFVLAQDTLKLTLPKLEKEKATRTIYYDKVLLARVDQEAVQLRLANPMFPLTRSTLVWLPVRSSGSLFTGAT